MRDGEGGRYASGLPEIAIEGELCRIPSLSEGRDSPICRLSPSAHKHDIIYADCIAAVLYGKLIPALIVAADVLHNAIIRQKEIAVDGLLRD